MINMEKMLLRREWAEGVLPTIHLTSLSRFSAGAVIHLEEVCVLTGLNSHTGQSKVACGGSCGNWIPEICF
jgi:hypothetical protein